MLKSYALYWLGSNKSAFLETDHQIYNALQLNVVKYVKKPDPNRCRFFFSKHHSSGNDGAVGGHFTVVTSRSGRIEITSTQRQA